jgi:hypothetical protein
METTEIETTKTVSDIQRVLSSYGATQIVLGYETGQVQSLSFSIIFNAQEIPFTLPCKWEPIFKHLQSKRAVLTRDKKKERDIGQARRVAWRQILRWIEAQFALVDTGMAQVQEVFLPYLLANDGKTLYQYIAEKKFKLLEHKEG